MCLLIGKDGSINSQMVDQTAEGCAKLLRAEEKIGRTRYCGFFRDVEELTNQARDALAKLQANKVWVPQTLAASDP